MKLNFTGDTGTGALELALENAGRFEQFTFVVENHRLIRFYGVIDLGNDTSILVSWLDSETEDGGLFITIKRGITENLTKVSAANTKEHFGAFLGKLQGLATATKGKMKPKPADTTTSPEPKLQRPPVSGSNPVDTVLAAREDMARLAMQASALGLVSMFASRLARRRRDQQMRLQGATSVLQNIANAQR